MNSKKVIEILHNKTYINNPELTEEIKNFTFKNIIERGGGYVESLSNFGYLCSEGIGVKKDVLMAKTCVSTKEENEEYRELSCLEFLYEWIKCKTIIRIMDSKKIKNILQDETYINNPEEIKNFTFKNIIEQGSGYIDSLINYSHLCYKGIGVKKDISVAKICLMKSIELGGGPKSPKIMERIKTKLEQTNISDLEIIQDIEYAKREDPKFDINSGDEDEWLLLGCVVHQNRIELARYLLKNTDIDVNVQTGYMMCSALSAVESVPMLKLLLEHKDIKVNIRDTDGFTVLHGIARCNEIDLARTLLLDARINVLIGNHINWHYPYCKFKAWDFAVQNKNYGLAKMINNSRYTTLLRIPNVFLFNDIIRTIICKYI